MKRDFVVLWLSFAFALGVTPAQAQSKRPNGVYFLVDNLGMGDRSRLLEIDPLSGRTLWSYEVPDDPKAFFSYFSGSNQRFENGNTLVTESDAGRAFEIDRHGALVWEYRTLFRVLHEGEERVASLFEVVRLPEAQLPAWIRALR